MMQTSSTLYEVAKNVVRVSASSRLSSFAQYLPQVKQQAILSLKVFQTSGSDSLNRDRIKPWLQKSSVAKKVQMKSLFESQKSTYLTIEAEMNRLNVIKITKMYLIDLEITVRLTYLLNPGLSSFLATKIKEKMDTMMKMPK